MGVRLSRRELARLVAGGVLLAGCGGTRTGAWRPRPTPLGVVGGPVRVPLPAATRDGLPLDAVLAARQSVRSFTAEPLTLAELGRLLWAAQGVTRSWGGRTAPSAGALYPLDVYAVTRDRLRHYLPAEHAVDEWAVDRDLRRDLQTAALGQAAVGAAPAVLVVTGTVARSEGKYGRRASRYVDLEAGHCAQNVLLQAVALGLGAVPVGAFGDAAVADVLGLPAGESPRYLVPVGHPATR